jgi:UDP-glucose 4-epimerase
LTDRPVIEELADQANGLRHSRRQNNPMITHPALILITGATGKVGQTLLRRLFSDPAFEGVSARALCHNRTLPTSDRLEVVRGNLADPETARMVLRGVTHVVHMAHVKETPEQVMDVAVKGLFWLLEESRVSETFRQFILIGGDNAVGHFVYPQPIPVTETQKHTPYVGCYALAKVLEEVMLQQYYIQYDLTGCCLRAPWVMEKDDFKYTLSFGEDVFGGPRWRDMVGAQQADRYAAAGAIPVLCDADGEPVLRNFVHVEDLVSAILMALDHPRPGSRPSISAWTSRWTTAKGPNTWARPADCPAWTSGQPSIPPGWTTPRRSSCLAGGLPTTCRA